RLGAFDSDRRRLRGDRRRTGRRPDWWGLHSCRAGFSGSGSRNLAGSATATPQPLGGNGGWSAHRNRLGDPRCHSPRLPAQPHPPHAIPSASVGLSFSNAERYTKTRGVLTPRVSGMAQPINLTTGPRTGNQISFRLGRVSLAALRVFI